MSILPLFILLNIISLNALAESDSTILQHVYAGSRIIIPKGAVWYLNRCFISDGSSYNIAIRKQNFKQVYRGNDTLLAPQYIPEMELLTDKSMVQFNIYFHIKK